MLLTLPVLLLLVGGPVHIPPTSCKALEYYVTPSDVPHNPACPSDKPCHTLNNYAKNSSVWFHDKRSIISLLFLDGEHNLTEDNLQISSIDEIVIAGVNVSSSDTKDQCPTIHILSGCTIMLSQLSMVRIENVSLVSNFEPFKFPLSVSLKTTGVQNFTLYNMVSTNCSFKIETTSLMLCRGCSYYYTSIDFWNIPLVRDGETVPYRTTSMKLITRNTTIIDSRLTLYLMDQGNSGLFKFECEMYETELVGSDDFLFAGVVISSFGLTRVTWKIHNSRIFGMRFSTSQQNNLQHKSTSRDHDAADVELKFHNSYLKGISFYPNGQGSATIHFDNCSVFLGTGRYSVGPALAVYAKLTNISLSVEDSHFTSNSSMYFVSSELESDSASVLLKNVSFIDTNPTYATLLVAGIGKVVVDSCLFERNVALVSPFTVISIDVLFRGNTTFSDNIGYRGGALHLDQSTIYLDIDTSLTFANNTAIDVGGAIYTNFIVPGGSIPFLDYGKSPYKCFYQLTFNVNTDYALSTSLNFVNNSAVHGGENIYGSTLKGVCPVTPDQKVMSFEIQSKLFHFDDNTRQTSSSVSSASKRVCLCENSQPICDDISYIYREVAYTSGELFSLSVALVGDDFGTVSGVVNASLLHQTNDSSIDRVHILQRIEHPECTTLEYSAHSWREKETLILSSDRVEVYLAAEVNFFNIYTVENTNISINFFHQHNESNSILLTTPIFINITILPCPLGFDLYGEPPTCQCDATIASYDIDNCTVTNGVGLVYRKGTTWVSHVPTSENETDGFLVHRYCPFEYCKTETVGVDLYHPNTQCAFNHTGILCGSCPSNLSLALGSSQCLLCTTNKHISLLTVFVVAGLGLVLLIKVLDITVTQGTINGLIFYSNVIWINQSLFFPTGDENLNDSLIQLMRILKVFIAWLNLDFGIETCFYQGMDAYWKTWLQFVFPIYIWTIAVLIIFVCRYSYRATRFFGNNTVHVLATLFLISYVKLLRTIVTALGFAILYYPDGARLVWLFDGNVPFFGLRHSFMFVAAVLALLVLWLPYTASLLFVPYLKKKADYYVLRWINKWKPFYDTYYGPLKDKHQYWIGLSLIVRVVLAVTAATVQAIAPIVNVLLINLISALLLNLVNPVYKKRYVSLIEASFLLNLVILSGAFLYSNDSNDKIIFICVSAGVCFMTCLGILIYHTYL